jgi:hypothetical protein
MSRVKFASSSTLWRSSLHMMFDVRQHRREGKLPDRQYTMPGYQI